MSAFENSTVYWVWSLFSLDGELKIDSEGYQILPEDGKGSFKTLLVADFITPNSSVFIDVVLYSQNASAYITIPVPLEFEGEDS